jgi:hypothetical protein
MAERDFASCCCGSCDECVRQALAAPDPVHGPILDPYAVDPPDPSALWISLNTLVAKLGSLFSIRNSAAQPDVG